jgi:cinnamyl-alcohol dehydrogenase
MLGCRRDGSVTYGGYSTHILVNEDFVLHVPDSLPLMHTAPLLCAGITMYSPIRKFGFDKPGMHIGVVGLVRT